MKQTTYWTVVDSDGGLTMESFSETREDAIATFLLYGSYPDRKQMVAKGWKAFEKAGYRVAELKLVPILAPKGQSIAAKKPAKPKSLRRG